MHFSFPSLANSCPCFGVLPRYCLLWEALPDCSGRTHLLSPQVLLLWPSTHLVWTFLIMPASPTGWCVYVFVWMPTFGKVKKVQKCTKNGANIRVPAGTSFVPRPVDGKGTCMTADVADSAHDCTCTNTCLAHTHGTCHPTWIMCSWLYFQGTCTPIVGMWKDWKEACFREEAGPRPGVCLGQGSVSAVCLSAQGSCHSHSVFLFD